MQKSDRTQTAKMVRRQTRPSTTLNRRYVKRPTKKVSDMVSTTIPVGVKKQTPMITRFGTPLAGKTTQEEKIQPAKSHPMQTLANNRIRAQRQASQQKTTAALTAKELKDQAIKKALQSAARQQTQQPSSSLAQQIQTKDTTTKQRKMKFGLGRIVLALSCAAAAIFAIVYFVNLNMPDLQFRAAAAQLDATYPNYIPHNFSPTGVASENGVVTLSFKNINTGDNYIITEEKSSWDSNSLLNNFVKDDYGDFSIIREQGLTIYVGDNRASWVNGGIVYKLIVNKGSLSKKQISSIAVSF